MGLTARHWLTFLDLASFLKGGPGSGYHGHAGRPGEVGGSAPAGTIAPATLARDSIVFPTEDELSKGDWESLKMTSSAAGKWKVITRDGREWFVKQPPTGDSGEGWNEQVAGLLAEKVSLSSLQVKVYDKPTGDLKNYLQDGAKMLIVSPWISEAKVLSAFRDKAPIENDKIGPALLDIQLFDFVTRNTDRHDGNIMFDADGAPILIDNGRTFSYAYRAFPGTHRSFLKTTGDLSVTPFMIDRFADGVKSLRVGADRKVKKRLDFANARIALLRSPYDEAAKQSATPTWKELRPRLTKAW